MARVRGERAGRGAGEGGDGGGYLWLSDVGKDWNGLGNTYRKKTTSMTAEKLYGQEHMYPSTNNVYRMIIRVFVVPVDRFMHR